MDETRCRSCGEPIVFVETVKGKKMPIDSAPDPRGNVIIGAGGVAAMLRPGQEYGGQRYTCHFDTCATPDQHRRKR